MCGNVTDTGNYFDRSVSVVSYFVPPSLSVVLGWVAYLGCKLVKLDVMLDMYRCIRVNCDHSRSSLAKDKIVRVVDGSDA